MSDASGPAMTQARAAAWRRCWRSAPRKTRRPRSRAAGPLAEGRRLSCDAFCGGGPLRRLDERCADAAGALPRRREDLRAPPRTLDSAAAPKSARARRAARADHQRRPCRLPADGVTKGDVAAYYDAVAARMAPHLDGRIVSLLRAPENIEANCFFSAIP